MDRLAQLIEETTDVRELKRAVSVELGEEGMATEASGAVLQVTPRAVRAWRTRCTTVSTGGTGESLGSTQPNMILRPLQMPSTAGS